MLSVLSVLALASTVLRTWPQFIRNIVKKEREGVSPLTWKMAYAAHVGWFMYGVLAEIPLYIVTNLLAALGCAATVYVLRSWKPVAGVGAFSVVCSVAAYAGADVVLLTLVTTVSIGMFIPQMLRVLNSPASGVSVSAWALAASSSATWIIWALVAERPELVIAHYFMLPASLLIVSRTLLRSASSRSAGRALEPVE